MSGSLWAKLEAHLFPGDGDEHGAVIAAGIVQTARGTRLHQMHFHTFNRFAIFVQHRPGDCSLAGRGFLVVLGSSALRRNSQNGTDSPLCC